MEKWIDGWSNRWMIVVYLGLPYISHAVASHSAIPKEASLHGY